VLHFNQMGNTLTIRLPEDLTDWLEKTARQSGVSRAAIIRSELEKARKQADKPWMRLAGSVKMHKGLSRSIEDQRDIADALASRKEARRKGTKSLAQLRAALSK
jgi:predicted transcriptional regulator